MELVVSLNVQPVNTKTLETTNVLNATLPVLLVKVVKVMIVLNVTHHYISMKALVSPQPQLYITLKLPQPDKLKTVQNTVLTAKVQPIINVPHVDLVNSYLEQLVLENAHQANMDTVHTENVIHAAHHVLPVMVVQVPIVNLVNQVLS